MSSPYTRIRNQAKKNDEEYLTAAVYKTHYNKNFEYLVRKTTHTQRTDVNFLVGTSNIPEIPCDSERHYRRKNRVVLY